MGAPWRRGPGSDATKHRCLMSSFSTPPCARCALGERFFSRDEDSASFRPRSGRRAKRWVRGRPAQAAPCDVRGGRSSIARGCRAIVARSARARKRGCVRELGRRFGRLAVALRIDHRGEREVDQPPSTAHGAGFVGRGAAGIPGVVVAARSLVARYALLEADLARRAAGAEAADLRIRAAAVWCHQRLVTCLSIGALAFGCAAHRSAARAHRSSVGADPARPHEAGADASDALAAR